MTVTVNGKPMELPEGLSVEDLLARLKIRREFTAVALNREVTQRARYAETELADGDKVEIVHPMGGRVATDRLGGSCRARRSRRRAERINKEVKK